MPLIRPSRLLPALFLAAQAAVPLPVLAAGVTGATLPAEAYLLPHDTVVFLAADVRGFFASPLWAQVSGGDLGAAAGLAPEKAAEMARQAQEGVARGMADMEAEMGFRADRDVDWVFFGLGNADAPSPQGVAVMTGRFDAARILSSAEAAQAKTGRTVSRKQVGAVSVLSAEKDGKDRFAVAVPGPGHLVIGDGPLVEGVLAAHAEGRHPLQGNPAVTARLAAVKQGTALYMVVGEALMRKVGQGNAPPPVPLPRSATLSVSLEGASEFAAEMATPEAAQEAAKTLQSQVAMFSALMAQNEDPQKAMAGKLLEGLAVEADGATLRITQTQGMAAGLAAAIVIPSLAKARVAANEAAAIGDVRTVLSAQAAYQGANRGFYGDLPCLDAPAACIKGYSGPRFLDAQLAALEVKSGYRRAFHPGPRGTRARSVRSFAYTAVPVERGKTGVRSFCGESSGVIRFDPKGDEIHPVGGVCPATLEALK